MYFSFIFLLSLSTKPDYGYLKEKLRISDAPALKRYFSINCSKLDFKLLSKDVEPFLFTPADSKKVALFSEYILEQPF